MENKLNVCQWNIRGYNSNKCYLEHLVGKYNINIIALQETFLNVEKFCFFKNFNIYRKDRNNNGGGVLLGIRKDISYREIKLVTELEMVAVQVLLHQVDFIICSIYLPPNISNAIEKLVACLKQSP